MRKVPTIRLALRCYADPSFPFYYMPSNLGREIIAQQRARDYEMAGAWKFTGVLKDMVGAHPATLLNDTELPTTDVPVKMYGKPSYFKPVRTISREGKYPVQIEGIEEACAGFFWNDMKVSQKNPDANYVRLYGIIFLSHDREACKNAESMYTQRAIPI